MKSIRMSRDSNTSKKVGIITGLAVCERYKR